MIKWGSGWDDQSVSYTKSKALFDAMRLGDNIYWSDFSEELKQDVTKAHNEMDWKMPYAPEPLNEDMDIMEALEYLESNVVYPITVLDHTEFYPSWNW